MLFSHWNGNVSVRTQRFRLDNSGLLFDMMVNPRQTGDVARAHPEVAQRLTQAVADWKKEVLTGFKTERPYPVGYAEFPITVLPARDGEGHGGVQRSARAPNCSFFKNWTHTNGSITWDVEVATAGKYQAEILYTCPQDSVGSTVELVLNDAKVQGMVSEANDPPLRGGEHDRASRGSESFVKDFKPLRLGEIELKAGRGTLTLRAVKVPGKQVMDVRSVVLTLVK
jgi:hypothetical protein